MERRAVPSNRLWSTAGYSRAIRVGNLIEVAGTSSSGPDGQILHPGDMYSQVRECLRIILDAIEELGGSAQDVIRTRLFLTNISLWEEAGRAHGEVFAEIRPVSAIIGVSALLHPDLLAEVEATAILNSGPDS